MPDALASSSPRRQRNRRIIRTVVGIYLAGLLLGSIAGYSLSSGPALARIGFGIVGIFIAMIAMWFASMVTSVVRSTHAALSHKKAPRG